MIDRAERFPWGDDDTPVGALLARRARTDGDAVYCRAGERRCTVGDIEAAANRLAHALAARGIGAGDRVAVMLDHHPDHVAVFFALAKLGACQVPTNIHLRGAGLEHLLRNSETRALVAESRLAETLRPALDAIDAPPAVIWRGEAGSDALEALLGHPDASPIATQVDPDAVVMILYTSGTTGLPKGVLLTDRMLRVSACAAGRIAAAGDGDVFHMWEPIYHIGGSEVLILAVQRRICLVMVERFSVSRFWQEVRDHGVTQLHFLGGVLALLLKAAPAADDRAHGIRLAWGGGCPVAIWRAFEQRFGIPIREGYGMTECASFATQNISGKLGAVGQALPWFDVRVADAQGTTLEAGARGEILVRGRLPGLITPGYWRNPEATAALLRDGWLHTGDLGWIDAEGDLFYCGRLKDSIRRRGENIAALEVERVLDAHPDIEESAVVGVPDELADEAIKAFIRVRPGCSLEPLDVIRWCETRLAYFQIPRFICFVDAFPKTPSERISKERLPKTAEGWDLQRAGYVPGR